MQCLTCRFFLINRRVRRFLEFVLDAGGIFINGSDAPMESVNPFRGMHAACARPEPKDRLTRREALASYSSWAACAEFGETRKGSCILG